MEPMEQKEEIMDANPWEVRQLEEFLYFCCPECDQKCQTKDSFLQHALGQHPKAEPCLKQFQIDKVEAAEEQVYPRVEIKEEVDDFEEDFPYDDEFPFEPDDDYSDHEYKPLSDFKTETKRKRGPKPKPKPVYSEGMAVSFNLYIVAHFIKVLSLH